MFFALFEVEGIGSLETVHDLKLFTLCDQLAVGPYQIVLFPSNFAGASIRPLPKGSRDESQSFVAESLELIILGNLLGVVVLGDDRD